MRVLVGLGLISAATLLFEILVTRFFALKFAYHMSFMMISVTLLGLGAGAVLTHISRGRIFRGGRLDLEIISVLCLLCSVTVCIAILFIGWCPYDPLRTRFPWLVFPAYFAIVAPPFVLSGIIITAVLSAPSTRVGVVYFVDLLAAGLGAAASAYLLEILGGYQSIALVALLAVLSSVCFSTHNTRSPFARILALVLVPGLLIFLLLGYRSWAQERFGFDIRSTADRLPVQISNNNFHGIEFIRWNALGRVHVSGIGESTDNVYRYGLSDIYQGTSIPGRFIFVDQNIVLRQFLPTGSLYDQEYLSGFVWSAPYILKPNASRTLIIGGGGGIDVLVARHMGVKVIEAVEINSDIFDLLVGSDRDPYRNKFQQWYVSDERSTVNVHHGEGRLYCSSQPPDSYDFVVSNATDTHSVVHGQSYNLTENFLYTVDAMNEYYRAVKTDGFVVISYWSVASPLNALRVFTTMISSLEANKVPEPGNQVVALLGGGYFTSFTKKGEFTDGELQRLKNWCSKMRFHILYYPRISPAEMKSDNDEIAKISELYTKLGKSTKEVRATILDEFERDIRPTTDEKPFFYITQRFDNNGFSGFIAGILPIPGMYLIVIPLLALSLGLVFIPPFRNSKQDSVANLSRASMIRFGGFFALCGFSFILSELGAIMMHSLFVGGPFYSLAVVLPAILVGYSVGSLLATKLFPFTRNAHTFVLLTVVMFLCAYPFLARAISNQLGAAGIGARVSVAFLMTLAQGIVMGFPVPWAMDFVKARHSNAVPIMWATNSVWNVVGSILHISIILLVGVTNLFIVAACSYGVAIWIIRCETASSKKVLH